MNVLPPELLLTCQIGATGLYDLTSGISVLAFKQGQASNEELSSTVYRKTLDYVEARNGTGGLVMGLHGPGKGALNIWSFAKESAVQRCILPAKLSCIALSPTGNYLVGGTETGRLFLWETASGALVASFDAHYRAVTCLAWTRDSDGAFVSGSEDATAHVWCMASLLAGTSATELAMPSPYVTLRDHTLAITDIAVGSGIFPRVRVLTSSKDGSCKVWDLLYPTASLMSSFVFPPPMASISHIALDELERYFFAAAAGPGKAIANGDVPASQGSLVRRVDLFRKRPDIGLSAGQMGDQVRVTEAKSYSTSSDVTSMHLSRHSPSLLLGLQNGEVLVLAMPSLQLIRTITPSALPAPAVTFVSTLLRPPDLIARANLGGKGGVGKENELRLRPIGVLSRTMEDAEKRKREHVVQIRLTGSKDLTHLVAPPLPPAPLPEVGSFGAASDAGTHGNRISELQAENNKLREQLARAIGINDSMWSSIVGGALPGIQMK